MMKSKSLSAVGMAAVVTFGCMPLASAQNAQAGFQRTVDQAAKSVPRGFVKREGRLIGKIDAFTYSSFVNVAGKSTFLPTDALVYIPPSMKSSVSKEKTGELVLWPDFYRMNRSRFHTVEVTESEFRGKTPISQERLMQWKSLGRIVVALYRGNPITLPAHAFESVAGQEPAAKDSGAPKVDLPQGAVGNPNS